MGSVGPEIPSSPLGSGERAPSIRWEAMRLPGGWEGDLLLGLAGPPLSLPAAPPWHTAWGWRMLNYFGKLLLCSSRSGLVLCMMWLFGV